MRGSSTPRPIDSMTAISGILDRPLSRTMTVEIEHALAFSRRDAPELLRRFAALDSKRAQGKPGARCTRGLVCKVAQKNAHEHTGPAEASRLSLRSGFYRLITRSPR